MLLTSVAKHSILDDCGSYWHNSADCIWIRNFLFETSPNKFWTLFPSKKIQFSKTTKFASEAYSEPYQASKMEKFAKQVNGFSPLTIFEKHIHGSEYASVYEGQTDGKQVSWVMEKPAGD